MPSTRQPPVANIRLHPFGDTTALVAAGPFALSRNPIYLGWFTLMLGLSIVNRSAFQLSVAVVMVVVLLWGVVLREEAYLEEVLAMSTGRTDHGCGIGSEIRAWRGGSARA